MPSAASIEGQFKIRHQRAFDLIQDPNPLPPPGPRLDEIAEAIIPMLTVAPHSLLAPYLYNSSWHKPSMPFYQDSYFQTRASYLIARYTPFQGSNSPVLKQIIEYGTPSDIRSLYPRLGPKARWITLHWLTLKSDAQYLGEHFHHFPPDKEPTLDPILEHKVSSSVVRHPAIQGAPAFADFFVKLWAKTLDPRSYYVDATATRFLNGTENFLCLDLLPSYPASLQSRILSTVLHLRPTLISAVLPFAPKGRITSKDLAHALHISPTYESRSQLLRLLSSLATLVEPSVEPSPEAPTRTI